MFLVPKYLCCFASVFLFYEPEQCYCIHNISRLQEIHAVKSLQKLHPHQLLLYMSHMQNKTIMPFFITCSKTSVIWELSVKSYSLYVFFNSVLILEIQ